MRDLLETTTWGQKAALLAGVALCGAGTGAALTLLPPAATPTAAARFASTPRGGAAAPQPQPTAGQRVTTLAGLVETSVAARAAVVPATSALLSCQISPAVVTAVLQTSIRDRQQVLTRLPGVGLAGGGGARVVAALQRAEALSARADEAYLQWAAADSNPCHVGGGGPALAQAGVLSADATRAKEQFCALWNPLAARYHAPEFTPAQL